MLPTFTFSKSNTTYHILRAYVSWEIMLRLNPHISIIFNDQSTIFCLFRSRFWWLFWKTQLQSDSMGPQRPQVSWYETWSQAMPQSPEAPGLCKDPGKGLPRTYFLRFKWTGEECWKDLIWNIWTLHQNHQILQDFFVFIPLCLWIHPYLFWISEPEATQIHDPWAKWANKTETCKIKYGECHL